MLLERGEWNWSSVKIARTRRVPRAMAFASNHAVPSLPVCTGTGNRAIWPGTAYQRNVTPSIGPLKFSDSICLLELLFQSR
jgi:hypothetical protein